MREQPTELTLQAQLEDLKEELEKMSAENAKLRAKSHEASRIQQYLYGYLSNVTGGGGQCCGGN